MTTNNSANAPFGAMPGTNDIRGIRPPVEIATALFWVLVAMVVLALILAAVAGWWFWRQRRQTALQPAPAPAPPPHLRARMKLQEALALIGQPRPFCILVSDTIRLYLEERFDFHAPERTTEEFLHELKATTLLLPDQKTSLGEFLAVCDMVKFAKYEPGPPELEALHESAVRLIDETEPPPPPENVMDETIAEPA